MKRRQSLILAAFGCILCSCCYAEFSRIKPLLEENVDENYAMIMSEHIKKGTKTIDAKKLIDSCLEKEGHKGDGKSDVLCCKVAGDRAYYAVSVGECPSFDVCFLSVDPVTLTACFLGSVTPSSLLESGEDSEWVDSIYTYYAEVADGFDQKPVFDLDFYGKLSWIKKYYYVSLSDDEFAIGSEDRSRITRRDSLALSNGLVIKNPTSLFDHVDRYGSVEVNGVETNIESLVMENEIAKKVSERREKMRFVGAAEFIGQDESVYIAVFFGNGNTQFPIDYKLVFELDIETMSLSYLGYVSENYNLTGIIRI